MLHDGPHADVETLLARMRDSAAKRQTSIAGLGTSMLAAEDRSLSTSGGALQAQSDFNRGLVESLRGILRHLGALESGLAAIDECFRSAKDRDTRASQQVSEHMAQLSMTFAELGRRIDAVAADLSALEQRTSHAAEETRIRVLRAERAVRSLHRAIDTTLAVPETEQPVGAKSSPGSSTNRNGLRGLESTSVPRAGERPRQRFDYFVFEHRFRGRRSDVKARQSAYLKLFLGRQNVVDLGCGRGEFVELLRENGLNVTGVDGNADMFEFCRDYGLPVIQADIFEYLGGLPDASLDGVFAAQIVEHLTLEQILDLIDLCANKLRPGGIMVAETPNTSCPLAFSEFFLDPTHVRPMLAQTLSFMFEQAHFRVQCLKFSAPVPGSDVAEMLDVTADSLPEEVRLYRDYAVVAVRL